MSPAQVSAVAVSAALSAAIVWALVALARERSGDPSMRRGVWTGFGLLGLAAVGGLAWAGAAAFEQGAVPALPTAHFTGTSAQGLWSFTRRDRGLLTENKEPSKDLRLVTGQPIELTLRAGAEATEFFVPGLGLRTVLEPRAQEVLRFTPAGPVGAKDAAAYRSVCLRFCRGDAGVRPFLVIVAGAAPVLAF
jgi:heme/copper-type cytochrome/quinol oxidase subunit 2